MTLWRRLYEPLGRRGRSIHPLELRLGIEAGLATPALAERVGYWATDHTQNEVLEIIQRDHGVSWSCTSLRKLLGVCVRGWPRIEKVPRWSRCWAGSSRPVPPRDAFGRRCRLGVTASLCRCAAAWHRRAPRPRSPCSTARGKRVGTVYLGQMPESGQGTITDQLSGLLKAILTQVDSQSLRLVYVSDEGHHPAPITTRSSKRWWTRAVPGVSWSGYGSSIFIMPVEYVQQLADTIFGAGDEAQQWAKAMRHVLKTKADGVARVLKSASALRRQSGALWPGQALR